ncbi:olfactory receptor 476-like [Hyla sarda]|uniref:olfactory receptor 476-like n=1 Tax=Hyla sarda TaxID=327740 RepID=UPI0024C2DC76|nr:olfactory receptor 476-like [Hyla sarda]
MCDKHSYYWISCTQLCNPVTGEHRVIAATNIIGCTLRSSSEAKIKCKVSNPEPKPVTKNKHILKQHQRAVEDELLLLEGMRLFSWSGPSNPLDSSDDRRDISRGFFYLVPCLHLVDKYQQIYIQENNRTEVTEFLLLGFQVSRGLRLFLFCLFLVVYCLIICGNLLIITLVSTSKNLHTPMYFFISHLSISDILVSSDIVPNLLHILLNNGATMTFIGCMTQFYLLSTSEASECLLLAVMSYDRYVAICNPLRYSSIMTSGHCVILTIISWFIGFSVTSIYTITIAKLNFCGPNVIDHIFCDLVPLLELSCSETFIIHLELYFTGIPLVFIPTTIIVLSYAYIVLVILRIPSNTGRQKAFSTCSSHLIVVSIFYGTIFSVYIVPTKGRTLTMSKILSLLYTVFTPLLNPIIYSLRNEDIKKAVQETSYVVNRLR